MGLQEHAAEKDDLGEEPIVQNADEEKAPGAEEAHQADADSEQQAEGKADAAPTRMEQMVVETLDVCGKQPPVEKFLELALIAGAMPGSSEYAELMSAIDKHCGNEYAALVEAEFASATELKQEAAPKEQEGAGADEPESAAAADKTAEPEEEKIADPALAEQQGPAADALPEDLAAQPAVKEEVQQKQEEQQQAAPPVEEVKEEKADAKEAAPEASEEKEQEQLKAPETDLKRGDSSPEVEELQKVLMNLGLMTQEEIDTGPGIFGPRTQRALAAFQATTGLPATGFYGPMTRTALASLSTPPSPVEQMVLTLIGELGPKPDMAVLVDVFAVLDPTQHDQFLGAVELHCGAAVAAQLVQALQEVAQPSGQSAAQGAAAPVKEPAADEHQQEVTPVETPAPEKQQEVAPVEAKVVEQVDTELQPQQVEEKKKAVLAAVPGVAPQAQADEQQEEAQPAPEVQQEAAQVADAVAEEKKQAPQAPEEEQTPQGEQESPRADAQTPQVEQAKADEQTPQVEQAKTDEQTPQGEKKGEEETPQPKAQVEGQAPPVVGQAPPVVEQAPPVVEQAPQEEQQDQVQVAPELEEQHEQEAPIPEEVQQQEPSQLDTSIEELQWGRDHDLVDPAMRLGETALEFMRSRMLVDANFDSLQGSVESSFDQWYGRIDQLTTMVRDMALDFEGRNREPFTSTVAWLRGVLSDLERASPPEVGLSVHLEDGSIGNHAIHLGGGNRDGARQSIISGANDWLRRIQTLGEEQGVAGVLGENQEEGGPRQEGTERGEEALAFSRSRLRIQSSTNSLEGDSQAAINEWFGRALELAQQCEELALQLEQLDGLQESQDGLRQDTRPQGPNLDRILWLQGIARRLETAVPASVDLEVQMEDGNVVSDTLHLSGISREDAPEEIRRRVTVWLRDLRRKLAPPEMEEEQQQENDDEPPPGE